MNEEGDEPVRWMASVHVKDIIVSASALLLDLGRKDADEFKIEYRIVEIERALKQVRFNLSEPLSKPTETTPDR